MVLKLYRLTKESIVTILRPAEPVARELPSDWMATVVDLAAFRGDGKAKLKKSQPALLINTVFFTLSHFYDIIFFV